jgi:hypothetical protein
MRLLSCPISVGIVSVSWSAPIAKTNVMVLVHTTKNCFLSQPIAASATTAKHIFKLTKIQISEIGQSSYVTWYRSIKLVGICHHFTCHNGINIEGNMSQPSVAINISATAIHISNLTKIQRSETGQSS